MCYMFISPGADMCINACVSAYGLGASWLTSNNMMMKMMMLPHVAAWFECELVADTLLNSTYTKDKEII